MADRMSYSSEFARLREQAFSRWDNEGGAGAGGREHPASTGTADAPPLSNAELVQLQTDLAAFKSSRFVKERSIRNVLGYLKKNEGSVEFIEEDHLPRMSAPSTVAVEAVKAGAR